MHSHSSQFLFRPEESVRTGIFLAISVIVLSASFISLAPEAGAAQYHPESVDRIKYGGFVGMKLWDSKVVALGRYDIVIFSDSLQPELSYRMDYRIGTLTGPSVMHNDTLYACGSLGIISVNLDTGMTSSVVLGYPTYDIAYSGGHVFVAAGSAGLLKLDSSGIVGRYNVTDSCNSVCIYNNTVIYTDGSGIRALNSPGSLFNMTSMIYRIRTLDKSLYVIYFDGTIDKMQMINGQYNLTDTMSPPGLANELIEANNELYAAVGSSGLWVYNGTISYTYKVNMALHAKAEGIKSGIVSVKLYNGKLLVLSTGFGLGYVDFNGNLGKYWFDSAVPAVITDTPNGIVAYNDYGLFDLMTGTLYQKYYVYSMAASDDGLYYSNEEGIYLYKDYDFSSSPILQIPLEAPALTMAWGYNLLYYSSGNDELLSLEGGVPIRIWVQPEHEKIISLHYSNSQLYIGTESALYVMSSRSDEPKKIMDLGNWCFDIDSMGQYVAAAAGESGGFFYNTSNNSVTRINTMSSAKSVLFTSGMLLIGTDRGVEIYDMSGNYQSTVSTRATVSSITLHHGCVYISTNGDGIYRIDLESSQQPRPDYQMGKALTIMGLLLLFIGVIAVYKGVSN